jgi:nanoRNase/pAp phosphatase (c-di-AMP/oligoRNAs hydrolase)
VREKGWVNLSIRGRRGLEIYLREATKRLAKRYGGFGGGRKKAGGASIPRKDCIAFIKDLEIELC